MTEHGADGADGFAARSAADRAFLGLELRPDGHAAFELTKALARHDGRLYGGTAVAAAVALAEHASGRPALWTTVQFVSGVASVGARIDCRVEVLAAGRRATQLRVSATVDGQEIFGALAATATPKDRSLTGVFEEPPAVVEPDLCEPFRFPVPESMRDERIGIERHMEIRVARLVDDAPRPTGEALYWTRARKQRATPAVLGYLADMVPMSVVNAGGHMGGGTSLDNTMRFGHLADTEWVLLQLHPHLALGGYGHGTAHLWSPTGTLLATASQTASLIVLD